MAANPLLRITQTRDPDKKDRFTVNIAFEAPDLPRQTVTCPVTFQ